MTPLALAGTSTSTVTRLSLLPSVGAANSARLDPYQHLAGRRLRRLFFDKVEHAGALDLHGMVCLHPFSAFVSSRDTGMRRTHRITPSRRTFASIMHSRTRRQPESACGGRWTGLHPTSPRGGAQRSGNAATVSWSAPDRADFLSRPGRRPPWIFPLCAVSHSRRWPGRSGGNRHTLAIAKRCGGCP